MEITETSHEPQPQRVVVLTEEMQYYLHQGGRWAYFLGILGFIATGFILIAALFVGTIFTAISQLQPAAAPIAGMGGILTVVYIGLAVFNFFFSLYLYRFGARIKQGVPYEDIEKITSALKNLKSFFKLWGIATIVIISLYILIFIIAIVGGIGAASQLANPNDFS
ncbi:MAG: hypothetical protein EOP46_10155 [Sphingobacteriaceae bacterium]|nr:MAG: hypothetical protein EOP46_10155 [Sphingobacteriaceae bacterium]